MTSFCLMICSFLSAGLAPVATAHRTLSDIAEVLDIDSQMSALVEILLQNEDVEMKSDDEKLFGSGCRWPAALHSRYTGEHEVGKGATACVYLATDMEGKTVAVKLAKSANKLEKWREECQNMQKLHLSACASGPNALSLMETYVPTCLEVGGTQNDPYYVMHAAGSQRISKAAKAKEGKGALSTADQIKIFSQFVAALYALHSVGWGHNDLHGGNVVLQGSRLSLIDFGSLRTYSSSKTQGSKRDGNRLWEHTAKLAKCGKASLWQKKASNDVLQQHADNLKQCLRNKWSVDEAFISDLDIVLQADIGGEQNQHMTELFRNKFVQDHLPDLDNQFQWLAAETCQPIKGSIA